MDIFLYVVAMFGGSLQYEPAFFWTVVGVGAIVAVAAAFGLPKLFKRSKA